MARPKKAKHRREPESIAHTLDELESSGDRVTAWVIEHPQPVLALIAAVLVGAAAYGGVVSMAESKREAASAALGIVQADYRQAMGANPDDVIVADPANPDVARRVREEYVGRFNEVAEEYPGTAGGAFASLEAGILKESLGEPEAAREIWAQAADELGSGNALGALLELRIASVDEAAGRWVQAGEAYERAAGTASFPLRATARAEAARCYAEAGEVERALETFERIKREDPDAFLPEHLEARLTELQVSRRLN